MRRVMDDIRTVAPTGAAVLIVGETGVGKELVARAIHQNSLLADQPLVTVNCAALASTLIESEFFGHERGAFTGAVSRKIGRFELADGGTIFLDEVGDLPLDLQAKLLRVLQNGEFERVGGTQTLRVNVRVISATNRHLQEAVQTGSFRADLYYRLSVFPIEVPALRTRRSDIPLLLRHFLNGLSRSLGKPLTSVTPRSLDALMAHDWPGNVRELLHVLERAAIRTRGTIVEIDGLGMVSLEPRDRPVVSTKLYDVERTHILEVLRDSQWVIEGPRGAATKVGLHPNTLRYRMKKLGIERPST
jgi:transcriptional regulator with GAF, ATPase, and Fis domain